jgi:hypothetical protein
VSGTYTAQVRRTAPACVVMLLDQSSSMASPIAGGLGKSKADAAAEAVNLLIRVLGNRASKTEGEGAREYFDVAVLGYHANGNVTPRLPGAARGAELISIKQLAANPVRIETRSSTRSVAGQGEVPVTRKRPVWLDPLADGGTPMREAITSARQLIERWARDHQASYPPIVINITDGMPNADPTQAARALTEISTRDGSALLYNIHLSGNVKHPNPLMFLAGPSGMPDKFAEMLFAMSSPLPDKVRQDMQDKYPTSPGARGWIYNSDPASLVYFLEVGTRTDIAEERYS